MEKADISRCWEIHSGAFAYQAENNDGSRRCFDFEGYFSRFIDDHDKYAFCIIADGQTVGYLTALEIPSFDVRLTIYIDSLAVAPAYQKRGYGSDALKQFFELFPKETAFRLQTMKDKPAYKMYEKIGFMDVGMQVMEHSEMIDAYMHTKMKLEQERRELLAELEQLEQEQKKLLAEVEQDEKRLKQKRRNRRKE
jgi:ribosomal protein S18 acetylase RimI-like enzyme